MPDRMNTKIKRPVAIFFGSAEDLLLSPGLRACDKTLRGAMILLRWRAEKRPSKSIVMLEWIQLSISSDRAHL